MRPHLPALPRAVIHAAAAVLSITSLTAQMTEGEQDMVYPDEALQVEEQDGVVEPELDDALTDEVTGSRREREAAMSEDPRLDLMAERLRPVPRGPYNFRMGPVLLRTAASLNVEYNDNINISADRPEADLIIYPEFRISTFWPISKRNSLSIDLGIGYRKYLEHSDLDGLSTSLVINPTTSLSFDVKVGDFYINIHDYPAIQNDPVDELTLSETLVFSRFTNLAGVGVRWDLNNVQLSLGYDHYNLIALTEDADPLERSEERVNGEAAFRISDWVVAGFRGDAALVDYSEEFLNDSTIYRGGIFSEMQLTRYISSTASLGYQGGTFESGGFVQDTSDLSGYYADFTMRHRLNRYVNYSASVGHESTLGTNTNFVEVTYLRFSAVWDIVRRLSLGTSGAVEYGDESAGRFGTSFVRYSFGANLGYTLTKHAQVGAFYRFVIREGDNGGAGDFGDTPGFGANDFKQNVVGIQFVYQF